MREDTRFPGAIGELVENAVKENVRRVAKRLRETDDVLSDPVASGQVKVVGACYGLGDGMVQFLDA